MKHLLFAGAALVTLSAGAQPAGWQACAGLADAARLQCFDRWAESQRPAVPAPAPAPATAAAPAPAPAPAQPVRMSRGVLTATSGCRNLDHSDLTRFWELDPAASCDTFGIRGYRPITLAVATADTVNRQPTSDNPDNTAATRTDYRPTEMRLNLSVRTKLAQNVFTRSSPGESDSFWFAYTQQSYWQIFTPGLSRPFRSTDHEPELIYVYPLQREQRDAWRWRYAGLGLVHQSNGQALPLSRSWNRAYVMTGAEWGRFQLLARAWKRLPEGGGDDNPGIADYVGRAEASLVWHADRRNLYSATLRHSLRSDPRGSLRLEWFRTLWDDNEGPLGGLQLHTQFFTGYGDTLLDYNRRRNVFSVGLSLVEW